MEVPNFTFTYDTVIRLKLIIPMQTEKRIRHSVHNVCGKASRIIDVKIVLSLMMYSVLTNLSFSTGVSSSEFI